MKKFLILKLVLMAVLSQGIAALSAQSNPWGLVYDGALRENIEGRVNIRPVTYQLHGIDIAANVYVPAGYDPAKKYAAIIVAHPNGGVKEQVAGLYAQHLAENGYVALVADASYQGASGGEPRHVDKPANRIEDIYGMADYITRYPGVDADRIGILGICGGGGYALKAAQSDKRLKVVATLSMFNSGKVRRDGFMGSQVATIQERLRQGIEARAQEMAGGEVKYTGDSQLTDEQIAKLPFDLYREGFIYYGKTHAHPNSTFRYTVSSLPDLMAWDATSNIDLINQPLLMVAGSKADSFYMTEEAFQKATGTTDKELFLIPGATHIQTYYVPEYVDRAVNKLVEFFGKRLYYVTRSATTEGFKQPYPLGDKLSGNKNFTGQAYLAPITTNKELNMPISNVTFEPGCRNSWHTHSGGQILIATSGIGYYQEKGRPARRLYPGDVVEIAPHIEHWHGAAPDSWFAHIAIKCNSQSNEVEWLNPVDDGEYFAATSQSALTYEQENKVLSNRQQAIVAIASYTGKGDLEHLKGALVQGLDAGMTVNEIKEILIHAYAYCGFPRSLRAIQTFIEVEKERAARGIHDEVGREATPVQGENSKYERGRDILAGISGAAATAPKAEYAVFAPVIEIFLKEHLFADIFERDLLSYQERELATVSVLAGVGGVEPMVYSHMGICLHLGITAEQLTALLNIIEVNLGRNSSDSLRIVLSNLINK